MKYAGSSSQDKHFDTVEDACKFEINRMPNKRIGNRFFIYEIIPYKPKVSVDSIINGIINDAWNVVPGVGPSNWDLLNFPRQGKQVQDLENWINALTSAWIKKNNLIPTKVMRKGKMVRFTLTEDMLNGEYPKTLDYKSKQVQDQRIMPPPRGLINNIDFDRVATTTDQAARDAIMFGEGVMLMDEATVFNIAQMQTPLNIPNPWDVDED